MGGTFDTLMECATAQWHPKIGDPSFVGWFITGGYAVLVLVIVLLLVKLKSPAVGAPRALFRFWILALVFYALLGLNKQMDLQTYITATGRCMSRAEGWYKQRREFQMLLAFAALAGGSVLMLVVLYGFRSVLRRCFLAILGAGLSSVYVALRLISMHHVDTILRMHVFAVKVHALLEIAGIVLVLLNAFLLLLMSNREPHRAF